MHGRLKVKTSAQEQEEKRKERERKLKVYRAGIDTVFKKRQGGELDGEVLQITEQLLCGNPDIYTLWNVRREALEIMRETKLLETFEEDLKGELRVTEAALRANPKSYGAWHHRMWVLESMKNPPNIQELVLCGKLLKADPRNFHCWDYRRWLTLDSVSSGKSDKMELDFSLEKLNENFSNYSAWHYRTLFLPRVHGDGDAPCFITRSQHKKELDLVQNAVFTDPGDQSAWFYLRWLLGKSSSRCSPLLRMGLLQLSQGSYWAALVLNAPMECGEQNSLQAQLRIGKNQVKGKWKCTPKVKVSPLWTFEPEEGNEGIKGALENGEEPSIVIIESGEEVAELLLKKLPGDEDDILEWVSLECKEGDVRSLLTPVLEEQLSLCTQLLDLEPDSRWALLTAVHLLGALKMRQPESKLKESDDLIMKYLDKLIAIDPLRSGYYLDLRSDCCLESALHPDKLSSSSVDLSSLGLSSFPSPLAPLPLALLSATHIDLSGNSLLTLPLVRAGTLSALTYLPRLRSLCISASFRNLSDPTCLHNFLPYLPRLLKLKLVPVDGDPGDAILSKDVADVIYKLMPSLRTLTPV